MKYKNTFFRKIVMNSAVFLLNLRVYYVKFNEKNTPNHLTIRNIILVLEKNRVDLCACFQKAKVSKMRENTKSEFKSIVTKFLKIFLKFLKKVAIQ